jgi:hypothetical protein
MVTNGNNGFLVMKIKGFTPEGCVINCLEFSLPYYRATPKGTGIRAITMGLEIFFLGLS